MPGTVTLYRHYSRFNNRPDIYAFEDRDHDTDNGRDYLLPEGWAEGDNEFRHGLIDPDGFVHDTIQADPDSGLPAIWRKSFGSKPDVILRHAAHPTP